MNHAFESDKHSGVTSVFSWTETPLAAPFAAAAAWNAAAAVSFGTWIGYWQALVEGARGPEASALMEGAFAPIETGSVSAISDMDLAQPETLVEETAVIIEEEALPEVPESLETIAEPTPEATVPASPKPPGLDAPRNSIADDLKLISGIGHKTAKTLNELGIWHYDQIARWTNLEAAWIDDFFKFKGRVIREKWIAQADALASGGSDEYLRRFGKAPK